MESAQYVVGSNMAGYMPDSDPFVADSYQHAIDCLIGDIEREIEFIDSRGDDDAGDEISVAEGTINKLEELKKSGKTPELSFFINHRCFWLQLAVD
jgi:hypothetical protein